LHGAEELLDQVFNQVKADARRRLGRLYNPADYPDQIQDLFDVAWDFPSVEPQSYLMQVAPEVYAEERQRVAARFEEAVRLAVQTFATEFSRLLAHLTERLSSAEDGQRKVFRDSAVSNFSEFFGRFRSLNVSSNSAFDALVEEAHRIVQARHRVSCVTVNRCVKTLPVPWRRFRLRSTGSSWRHPGVGWSVPGPRTTEVPMELRIDPDGTVRFVYDEALDLSSLGSPSIRRASQVEPDAEGRWWSDLSPVQGPMLGPFARRSEALAAEATWLATHWPTSASP
jgi:hypothetical protein